MNRDSMKQLEIDVRMLRRRNWIKKEDLEKRLDALPDVSDKAAPVETETRASDD